MRVGLIGLGRLGQAMGERLLDRGLKVALWNRSPKTLSDRLSKGIVGTIEALAAQVDCILIAVRDDNAFEEVVAQLCQCPIAGKLVMQVGTVRPDTARGAVAAIEQKGARFLDAPVSGTVAPARNGTLLFMVGGAKEDFDAAQPVLEALGRKAYFVGEAGKASLMKLAVNSLLLVYWQGLGEAMALGKAGGLEPKDMLEVICDSAAGLPLVKMKSPVILGSTGDVGFDVYGASKDLTQIADSARSLGQTMPAVAATAGSVNAAIAAGFGDRDVAELVRYLIDHSDLQPQH